jgi:hypothetical protein
MDSLIRTSLIGTKLQMNGGNRQNKKYCCQQRMLVVIITKIRPSNRLPKNVFADKLDNPS